MSKKNSRKLKPKLKIKKLVPDAILPTRAKTGDAGYDLYASKNINITTGNVGRIPTGVALEIPKGYWAKIHDRSGFFTNVMMSTGAGVIDNGYRGEIIICAMNNTTMPIRIHKGEKIAQGVLFESVHADIIETNELNETDRNDKGFGSSD